MKIVQYQQIKPFFFYAERDYVSSSYFFEIHDKNEIHKINCEFKDYGGTGWVLRNLFSLTGRIPKERTLEIQRFLMNFRHLFMEELDKAKNEFIQMQLKTKSPVKIARFKVEKTYEHAPGLLVSEVIFALLPAGQFCEATLREVKYETKQRLKLQKRRVPLDWSAPYWYLGWINDLRLLALAKLNQLQRI